MKYLISLFLLIITSPFVFALEINDSLRLDGYANINTLLKSKNNEDRFTINGGLQGRYQISDKVSFTGHLYFEEDRGSNSLKDYEEDVKWLYFDYYLGNEITLRAGKFQFPIFTASEIGTIGYSRTWTENPISSYGAFGYDNFTGAEFLKSFSYEDYDFLFQLSYGESKNVLPSQNDNNNTINGTANSILGLTLKSSNDWLMLNFGYIKALSIVNDNNPPPGLVSEMDVDFDMYAIETQADFEDLSFKAGFIRADLSNIFPDEQRYYTSIEYNYNNFTPYVYYANEILDFKVDNLSGRVRSKLFEKEIYSTGIRYDINKNMSFKLSYTKNIENLKFSDETSDTNKGETFKGTINVLF